MMIFGLKLILLLGIYGLLFLFLIVNKVCRNYMISMYFIIYECWRSYLLVIFYIINKKAADRDRVAEERELIVEDLELQAELAVIEAATMRARSATGTAGGLQNNNFVKISESTQNVISQ